MITVKKTALTFSIAMLCALGEATIYPTKNISSAIASTPISTSATLAQLSNEVETEVETEEQITESELPQ